jgi:hypothetical protein
MNHNLTPTTATPGARGDQGALTGFGRGEENHSARSVVSHAAGDQQGIRAAGPPPHTPQRDMVRASLLLGDATERHACYPRRIPGSSRHA